MEYPHKKNVGLTESDTYLSLENLQESQRIPSINPINLNYYGKENCESGHSFGPFVRTSYLLHIVKTGSGVLKKGNNTYHIRGGQAFLIYPGEETVYQADEEDPWSYMWVGFHGLRAEEMMSRAGFSADSPVITCTDIDKVTRIMEELLSFRKLTYVNELMRTGSLYQLIGALTDTGDNQENSRNDNDPSVRRDNSYVTIAVNLLINSSQPRISVSEVAKTIGISRSYLTSLFKKEMHVSPQEYLVNFRMEKAGSLLRSTRDPVSTIAEAVGYIDVLSFSKCFRRHFGVSPTKYRETDVVLIQKRHKGEYQNTEAL